MNAAAVDPGDVKAFISDEGLFLGEIVVAFKNENSELLEKVKPCNMEFFDRVFNRLLWDMYSEMGLSYRPYRSKYMAFLNHEMFFCKNTENRFMSVVGGQKRIYFEGGRIVERVPFDLANLVFSVAKPVEMVRNAFAVSVAALRINDRLRELPEHHRRSVSFWEKNRAVKAEAAADAAPLALDGALASMRYSLMASAAASLGIRLRQDGSSLNLVAAMLDDASRLKGEAFVSKYGHFSMRPYDVSRPCLDEDPSLRGLLLKVPAPSQPHYVARENAKVCCGIYLAVLRKCYLAFAGASGLGEDVFYLKPAELKGGDADALSSLCASRRRKFESATHLPSRIAFQGGVPLFEEALISELSGLSAGARTSASGRLVIVESLDEPVQISPGDVIASRHLSPELVIYYGLCSAVISETGGRLAHAAIVALERNMPCVVQVEGFDSLKAGMTVRVDGATGKITVLSQP